MTGTDRASSALAAEGDREPFAATTETHSAVVMFVGDRAYKLKKPLDLGFLDFSTRELRLAACRREVELNRRFAPDVYLGVADVSGPDGALCEHLVAMRRMPAQRRLSTLVEGGEDVGPCLREVARRLARVHAEAAVDHPEVATRDAVAINWDDNLAVLHEHPHLVDSATLERVAELVGRYLAGRSELFERRIASGMVRDGHGDLLCEDIFCLDDGPRVLDCLEFADRYRFGDVLLDAAFLVMDLQRRGRPADGRAFLRWYAEFSGEHHPSSLAHHYVAYRAGVRAKVACIRGDQLDTDADGEATQLLAIARDHLERARIRLVLVGGLPGTGKSTLATALAEAQGWTLLRSDELRKDLAGLPHDADVSAAPDEGLYAPAITTGVYSELLRRARRLLALGESVVLDASWTAASQRVAAAQVADEAAADLVALRCEAPIELAAARLLARATRSSSDATPEVLEVVAARADPWPEATTISTLGSPDTALREALHAAAPPRPG